jgi:hypothetical protein
MKAFYCDDCGQLLFFENVRCLRCDHPLGFLPDVLDLSALEPDSGDEWRALSASARERRYRLCQNGRDHQVCNWYVPSEDPEPLCIACRMNLTIPDLTAPGNLARWHKLELAKRRLVYTLLHLRLPLRGAISANRPPLQFKFLSAAPGESLLTGHAAGVITLNIIEADDAEREKRRVSLHEPYRTLLGHFRHESGHFYWDQLISSSPRLEPFRERFGDERKDYSTALSDHYQRGPAPDWHSRCVSAYASVHPWEDWAETWAHYLHMVDMIETAAGFGMKLTPKHPSAETMTSNPAEALRSESDFDQLLQTWFPLTHALNSLNRGMGLTDLYPFVLSTAAVEKLRFVHEVIHCPPQQHQASPGR